MRRFASLIAAVSLAGLVMVPAARAEPLPAADQAAIQALIADQIDAFRRDDGPAAYQAASPGIREIFPTVETFMAMMRQGYMPVYRPQSVVFGPLEVSGDQVTQKVFVTGPDGLTYTALYSLERQQDGGWLISGCVLLKPAPTI